MRADGRDPYDWNCQVTCKGDFYPHEEILCLADNFDIAMAAFEAATQARTMSTIMLHERSRLVRTVRTGLFDHTTKRCEIRSDSRARND